MESFRHFIKDKQDIIYWHPIHSTIINMYFYMVDRYITNDDTYDITEFVVLPSNGFA